MERILTHISIDVHEDEAGNLIINSDRPENIPATLLGISHALRVMAKNNGTPFNDYLDQITIFKKLLDEISISKSATKKGAYDDDDE